MNTPTPVYNAGPATLALEFKTLGRHFGALTLPHPQEDSAYGQIVIPIAVINGGEGSTMLFTGGVHGDEYEGQLALREIAVSLDPATIRGRAIIVPVANPAASRAGRRLSPFDSGDLARSFPGRPDGTLTEQVAWAFTELLLSRADYLVDLHSGGRSLEYYPCAFGRLPEDPAQATAVRDLMLAFGAPAAAFILNPVGRGTMVSEALDRGVIAMAAELGGGGGATPTTLDIARTGIRRCLAAAGLTDPFSGRAANSRLMVVQPEHFVRAPHRGAFAPAVGLGDQVEAGDIVGHMHDLERFGRAAEPVHATGSGIMLCRRIPARAAPGDVLMHLAQDIAPQALVATV